MYRLYFFPSISILSSTFDKIKNVVASYAFKIKNVQFVEKNVSVKNGTYAGGLAVKPDVLVQIKGQTLVEGKDYELKFYIG